MLTLRDKYKDFNLDFTAHPDTGDIIPLKGADAVKRSVRNLVLTNFGERPFKPNISGDITSLLFENFTPQTRSIAERQIRTVLSRFEPRANIITVNVTRKDSVSPFDSHILEMTIRFSVGDIADVQEVFIILERVR